MNTFQTTQKNCAVCKTAFGCGNTEEGGGCWCNDYPPIFELNNSADCLCPACLKEAAISKINAYTASLTSDGVKNNKATKLPATSKLMEGIDFYVEGGRYVFTAWYHLKRGACCGNGCRHCPYDGNFQK